MHRINKALLSTLFISGMVVNTTQPFSFDSLYNRVYQSAENICSYIAKTGVDQIIANHKFTAGFLTGVIATISTYKINETVKAHPKKTIGILAGIPAIIVAYQNRQAIKDAYNNFMEKKTN